MFDGVGKTAETLLTLLFGAIVIGVMVTNPEGVKAFFQGVATFTGNTVDAFSGKKGFAARTGSFVV